MNNKDPSNNPPNKPSGEPVVMPNVPMHNIVPGQAPIDPAKKTGPAKPAKSSRFSIFGSSKGQQSPKDGEGNGSPHSVMSDDSLGDDQQYNILNIVERMAQSLEVNSAPLIEIVREKIPENQRVITDINLRPKIDALLSSDNSIGQLDRQLTSPATLAKFQGLKEQLGKLQVFALVQKLQQSGDCEDVLNTFFDAMNQKIEAVNGVLSENLSQPQHGGGDNSSVKRKLLKYRLKHHELVKKLYGSTD